MVPPFDHRMIIACRGTVGLEILDQRPGSITFEHVRAFVDEVVTVSDEAIAKAVAWLSRHARLVSSQAAQPRRRR